MYSHPFVAELISSRNIAFHKDGEIKLLLYQLSLTNKYKECLYKKELLIFREYVFFKALTSDSIN
jgi:hypothetical protein